MVFGERRGSRRHDRERRAGGARGRSDPRSRRHGAGPRVHRHARPLGVRAGGGSPRPEQDRAGGHHRGPRGASFGRAGDGPGGGRPDDGRAAHRARLDHPGRISRPARVRRGGAERRVLRGLGTGARLRRRLRGSRTDRRRAAGHGGAGRPGDGRGGVRAGERHGLHPEHLHEHRGAHPADPGRGRLRRHLREPPARRARRTRRGHHHRPRDGNRAGDPPPELHLGSPHPGIRGDDRGGARLGSGRDREHLPVHRGVDLPALAVARLGPGRGRGPDAPAAHRSRRPGPAPRRTPGIGGHASAVGAGRS